MTARTHPEHGDTVRTPDGTLGDVVGRGQQGEYVVHMRAGHTRNYSSSAGLTRIMPGDDQDDDNQDELDASVAAHEAGPVYWGDEYRD